MNISFLRRTGRKELDPIFCQLCLGKESTSLKTVQRRATRLIPGLKYLEYVDRLQVFGMPSLVYNRRRGIPNRFLRQQHNSTLMPPLVSKVMGVGLEDTKRVIDGDESEVRKRQRSSTCIMDLLILI